MAKATKSQKAALHKPLTVERLRELLHYDMDTGIFTNRIPRGKVKAGSVAGATGKVGYVGICIDYRLYYAHRLAWFYVHGFWPKIGIDHWDVTPSNNKISNLREANQSLNGANQHIRKNNRSGFKGVSTQDRSFSCFWSGRPSSRMLTCSLASIGEQMFQDPRPLIRAILTGNGVIEQDVSGLYEPKPK